MKLVIAEKPDLGKAIAEGITGTAKLQKGYIEKGDYIITWAFGHLLQLYDPEDYDLEKYGKWNKEVLPIYFEDWKQKPKTIKPRKNETQEQKSKRLSMEKSSRDQLELIGTLLKKCDGVIHAGDPDDEGQFLIDEILQYFNNKKSVERVLINDNNIEAVKKSLKDLQPNEKFEPLGRAAYARAVSDFITGLNLTRFYSLNNPNAGLLSVGRVQTPTLQMIVARDIKIERHEKEYYYELFTDFEVNKNSNKSEREEAEKLIAKYESEFANEEKRKKLREELLDEFSRLNNSPRIKFKYYPSKDVSENGRVGEEEILKTVKESLDKYSKATITKTIAREEAYLPFNLMTLQIYANNKWGYSADKTLEISQALRDKYKAITYNRSDSQYLNEEHLHEAPEVIERAIRNLKVIVPGLNFEKLGTVPRCFDSSKVTAHHAIIPTNTSLDLSDMTDEERNIYTAIANYYIIQFLPKLIKEKTEAEITFLNTEKLKATSTKVLDYGFKFFLNDRTEDDEIVETTDLSKLYGGEYEVGIVDHEIKKRETSPPKRYTEGTLLQDMASISKYCNEETKKILREKDKEKKGESGGIGTPATRSNCIKELINRGYIEVKGKNIISTEKAREFLKILPEELKQPDLTAQWWLIQEEIKENREKPSKLILSVLNTVSTIISREYPKVDYTLNSEVNSKEVIGKCPKCGGDIHEGKTKEGKTNYYCGNYKEKNCKFKLSEEMKHFHNPIKITKTKAKNLLKEKPVEFKLTSKAGKDYEAYLKLKISGDFINFEQTGYVEKKQEKK